MNQRIPQIFKTYIAVAEFAGLTGLYFFSIFLMTGDLKVIVDTVFLLGYILLLLIRLILIKVFNPYNKMTKRDICQEIKSVVQMNIWQSIFMILALYITAELIAFNRMTLLIFFFLEVVLDFAMRCCFKVFLTKYFRTGSASQKLLIITTSGKAEYILKTMKANEEWYYVISGCVILDQDITGQKILGVPVVAGKEELHDYILYHVVDAVFIDGNMSSEEFHRILELLDKIGSEVYINMSNFGMELANERVVRIGGFTTLASSAREITPLQNLGKRALDIAGGLVGSVLTLLLTVILFPLIKMDSKGSVFFVQKRVGQNGRIFNMYKFRSMCQNAEEQKTELEAKNKMEGLMFKVDDDPRVTKVGEFLRRTSLDEFPQFFNVLKGDMSLVGTRPPTVNEFEKYHAHHKKRLSMKPGITGLWQVSGRNDITDFEEVVKLDAEYIDSWDIGMDLRILIKTIYVVFKRKGAL